MENWPNQIGLWPWLVGNGDCLDCASATLEQRVPSFIFKKS